MMHPWKREGASMWDDKLVERLASKILGLLDGKYDDCVYGDVRFVYDSSRTSFGDNGVVKTASSSDMGFGIRVLTRGDDERTGWGFASSCFLDEASAERVVDEAVRNGRANRVFQPPTKKRLPEYEGAADGGYYESPVEIDPFAVSEAEWEKRLAGLDRSLDRPKVKSRSAFITAQRQDRRFFSTSGARQHQLLTWTGAMFQVTVGEEGIPHRQSRSFPQPSGNFAGRGYEYIDSLGLEENCDRIYGEALEILAAPECPRGRMPVVIGPQMMALLVHEVAGHALELDRALKVEAAYAGASFLDPAQLGRFRYGAEIVNIVSDPTWPGAVATYGWDDEGTRAKKVPMIEKGIHVGYLGGRSNSGLVGLESAAACRSTSWNRLPIDRMTNVNLLPGDTMSAQEIISSVEDGLYLDVPCGWSINSDRNGFRFSVEVCRRIRGGKLEEWLRRGAFASESTPAFWARCRAIASDEPFAGGFNNCAKGQPVQIQYTGHVVPQAVLFDGVEVGEKDA